MNPFIFVHIPKTGGTSLREALIAQYSKKELLWDYGEEAKETSRKVKKLVHKNPDLYALASSGIKAIYGHFPVNRYIGVSSCTQVVAFLRDPIERAISEYKHQQRAFGYSGTLREFAHTRRFINTQSQFLNGIPWGSVGFLGIAERYDESINLLSEKVGFELKEKRLNVAPDNQQETVNDSQRRVLTELNKADIHIYRQANIALDWRLKLRAESLLFVLGGWHINKAKSTVSGFAFNEHGDDPVMLSLKVDGKQYDSKKATLYHGVMHKFRAPRKGYVGFTFDVPITDHGRIAIEVESTKQPIPRI